MLSSREYRCNFVKMAAEEPTVPAIVAAADEEPWLENAGYKTRPNSPTARAEKSAIWKSVRRLCDDHPKAKEGYTHVCVDDN